MAVRIALLICALLAVSGNAAYSCPTYRQGCGPILSPTDEINGPGP
jgi:hypothetical protein